MENLADDLQRLMSLMLELDAKTQGKRSRSRSTVERPSRVLAQLRQLRPQFQTYVKSFSDDGEGDADRRSLYKDVLQGILRCREFGDEKIQYSSQMQELVRRLSRGGERCESGKNVLFVPILNFQTFAILYFVSFYCELFFFRWRATVGSWKKI